MIDTTAKSRFSIKQLTVIYTVVSLLSLLVVWELVARFTSASMFLPPASQVLANFFKSFVEPVGKHTMLYHIGISLYRVAVAFALATVAGIALGVGMGYSRIFEAIFKPIFEFIRPIPPLAWIPLMILWFGIGYGAKVAIIFISAMIACVVNSYAGIKQTRQVHIWVAQTFAASDLQILLRVALPTAWPMIFTGLKTSLGSAWMALVAAELLASTSGLGYMIQMARQMGRADIIVVGMIVIGLIGAALSALLDLLAKKLVKRRN